MKLYTAEAPNPRRVNIFIAEKGIDIPTEWMQLLEGEARTPEFLKMNSLGEAPVLELDDGSYLTESIAICRYLESLYPDSPLFGETPLEAAQVEMWTRRMEQKVCEPIGQFGLHTFPFFADKIEQVRDYADTQLRLQERRWEWLNDHLSDGATYVCNNTFSIADIAGVNALNVMSFCNLEIPDDYPHVKRWEAAMRSRKGWSRS